MCCTRRSWGAGSSGGAQVQEHQYRESVRLRRDQKGGVASATEAGDIRREVACLALLQDHPGFVRMHRAIEDSTNVHIVMEALPGGDLLDYILSSGPLSESQAAKLCCSLTESLLHCHCLGIMHHVKPENILLTASSPEGPMKLSDFGVASFFTRGVPLGRWRGQKSIWARKSCGGPTAQRRTSGVPGWFCDRGSLGCTPLLGLLQADAC